MSLLSHKERGEGDVVEHKLLPKLIKQIKLGAVTASGPTEALGSVTFAGSFEVHGVRGVSGLKGLFVGMPRRKEGDEHRDMAHPITGEL